MVYSLQCGGLLYNAVHYTLTYTQVNQTFIHPNSQITHHVTGNWHVIKNHFSHCSIPTKEDAIITETFFGSSKQEILMDIPRLVIRPELACIRPHIHVKGYARIYKQTNKQTNTHYNIVKLVYHTVIKRFRHYPYSTYIQSRID